MRHLRVLALSVFLVSCLCAQTAPPTYGQTGASSSGPATSVQGGSTLPSSCPYSPTAPPVFTLSGATPVQYTCGSDNTYHANSAAFPSQPTGTLTGNVSGSTQSPGALSPTQAAAVINAVTTTQTTVQSGSGPVTFPVINKTIMGDGFAAGTTLVAYNSGAIYSIGNAVSNAGVNYIAINLTPSSGNTPASSPLYWYPVVNTGSFTPTQYDVAKAYASAYAVNSNQNVGVKWASGSYSRCADIPLPRSASGGTVSEWGEGYGSTIINQTCSINEPMVYLPVGSAINASIFLHDIQYNGSSNSTQVLQLNGTTYGTVLQNLQLEGGTASSSNVQLGTAGSNGAFSNSFVTSVKVQGVGGAGTLATATATFAASTITLTVSSGGSGYVGLTATVYFLGQTTSPNGKNPCSTMPTNPTVPISGGAVTTGVYTYSASGCIAAPYANIQNTPQVNYIVDEQNMTDSRTQFWQINGVSAVANLREQGSGVDQLSHICCGFYQGIQNMGSWTNENTEMDSPIGYGYDIEGPSAKISLNHALWNTTSYPGSGDIFLNTANSINGFDFTGQTCWSNQNAGGYTLLVDITGSDAALTGANGSSTTAYGHSFGNIPCNSALQPQNVALGNWRYYANALYIYSLSGADPSLYFQGQTSGQHTWQLTPSRATPFGFSFTDATAGVSPLNLNSSLATFSVPLKSPSYLTANVCTSTASPAVCGSAAAGKVQVAASSTSLVVNTTAVTANSEIGCLTYSTEGLTAPTNMASLLTPYVSARTAGTSFTLTLPVAPATNAINLGYCLIN